MTKNIYFFIFFLFSFSVFTQENCDGNCVEGYGIYTFHNNDTYKGTFVNRYGSGFMEGYGTYFFSKNNSKYEGEFRNDMPNGLGKMTYRDGTYFEGSFVDGQIDGFGIYYSDGRKSIGEWYRTRKISSITNAEQLISNSQYDRFKELWSHHQKKWNNHLKNWDKFYNSSKIVSPPILSTKNVYFDDVDKILDGGENSSIRFTLTNEAKDSKAQAKGIIVNPKIIESYDQSINFIVKPSKISYLNPGESKDFIVELYGDKNSLKTGTKSIEINIDEKNGWGAAPVKLTVNTREYRSPKLKITSSIAASEGQIIEKAKEIQYKFIVQNIGQGTAENVWAKVYFSYSENETDLNPIMFTIYELDKKIPTLGPGEFQELSVGFMTKRTYKSDLININIDVYESEGSYGYEYSETITMGQESVTELDFSSVEVVESDIHIEEVLLNSKVDEISEIPIRDKVKNRYALIIGNENYAKYSSTLNPESDVQFALNDAKIFKQYAIRTLGIYEDNVYDVYDGNAVDIKRELDLVCQLLQTQTEFGDSVELFFYYAGHGYPDKKNKPHLIPIGVDATNVKDGFDLSSLYSRFSNTGAQTYVFLDACFSGGARGTSLEESRKLHITPDEGKMEKKVIVFAATSENQTALPYNDEKHGIFTYHLLEKLKETKGDVSLGELEKHLISKVKLTALKEKRSEQDPKVLMSPDMINIYKTINIY